MLTNGNPDYITAAKPSAPKQSAAGIGAVTGPALLRTLERLGLVAHSPEFEKLVASGTSVGVLGPQFSVYQIDQALAQTDATTQARMQFKTILNKMGLIKHDAA
jgi:hypothetical protein